MIIFWLIFQNYNFYTKNTENTNSTFFCKINIYFFYFKIILKIIKKKQYVNHRQLIFLKRTSNECIKNPKNAQRKIIKICTLLSNKKKHFFVENNNIFFQFNSHNFIKIYKINLKFSYRFLYFFIKIEKKIYRNYIKKIMLRKIDSLEEDLKTKSTQIRLMCSDHILVEKNSFFDHFKIRNILVSFV